MFGIRPVTTEVARRTTSGDAQPARFDQVDSRRDLGNGAHDRFELAGITRRVVVEEADEWAALLRLAAALPDHDPLVGRCRRSGHDPIRA